jgi:hypothetical protein
MNQRLNLPAPLPSDVTPQPGSLQEELFKSTSAIDIISILSICATRPEFVPRAYHIFQQLLADVKAGKQRAPEAKVWATVIKAMEKLGAPSSDAISDQRASELWRHRAESLVEQWEVLQAKEKKSPHSGQPALDHQGILIYRAWFAGMIE